MENIDKLLESLSKTKFRGSFHLDEKMKRYVIEKGMNKIVEHAYDFVRTRLAPANILNDGWQTPYRGHPVFIAQHATGTCCRGCLMKIHKIEKNKKLSNNEIDYVVNVITSWIRSEVYNGKTTF